MINIKDCLNINGIFQFCLCPNRRDTLCKIYFFFIYTANYNVGVSDING